MIAARDIKKGEEIKEEDILRIKSCPFCGETKYIELDGKNTIWCKGCQISFISMPDVLIIDIWNKRVIK